VAALVSTAAEGARVALVTGGGRGIGRATAIALARAGARVTVTARTREEVARVAAEIGGDFIAASAATAAGCAAIVEETRRRSGPIDILVCSAGIGGWGEKPIWELTHERWRETLATNLDGPFFLSRLVTGEMTRRAFGRIVFVSSTAGEVGGPQQPAYCASKHGVIGLMRAVAQDVIPFGVTCNAVLPGWVRTRMADDDVADESRRSGRSPEEIWASHAAEYAAGRVLDPSEVAAAIAFLCSDGASGVNGEAMRVALGGLW
jgi:NAD(P)-dependent dehydrogenase (short-subunit alcohol dehydrogenase family)